MKKQLWSGIGEFIGMLILILDGKTALQGAQQGIELCLRTVIPSLFPFFLLSILLTSSFLGSSLPVLRPLANLCGMPNGAESILVSGFLGGYPVGAQSIAAAYHSGQLDRKDAERMLAFCNNAGPAFLFGMVASMFPKPWIAWALWGIHIASAILVSLLIPGNTAKSASLSLSKQTSLPEALHSSITVMATVCGWVLLFRVVIAFLNRWVLWLLPTTVHVAITGLLELSNGCCELASISDTSLRFILCSAMLALGGICVTMQTMSVTYGLSLRYYFIGKLLQMIFSFVISAAVILGIWLPCCIILLFFSVFLRKAQKRSSIPKAIGV